MFSSCLFNPLENRYFKIYLSLIGWFDCHFSCFTQGSHWKTAYVFLCKAYAIVIRIIEVDNLNKWLVSFGSFCISKIGELYRKLRVFESWGGYPASPASMPIFNTQMSFSAYWLFQCLLITSLYPKTSFILNISFKKRLNLCIMEAQF